MRIHKTLGVLLLILAVATVAGLVLNSDAYWQIYNYCTILISVAGGVFLLKQK
ncbi:MAG: hypothetical protein WC133_05940 [Candidatus Omnitrophota bacterium]